MTVLKFDNTRHLHGLTVDVKEDNVSFKHGGFSFSFPKNSGIERYKIKRAVFVPSYVHSFGEFLSLDEAHSATTTKADERFFLKLTLKTPAGKHTVFLTPQKQRVHIDKVHHMQTSSSELIGSYVCLDSDEDGTLNLVKSRLRLTFNGVDLEVSPSISTHNDDACYTASGYLVESAIFSNKDGTTVSDNFTPFSIREPVFLKLTVTSKQDDSPTVLIPVKYPPLYRFHGVTPKTEPYHTVLEVLRDFRGIKPFQAVMVFATKQDLEAFKQLAGEGAQVSDTAKYKDLLAIAFKSDSPIPEQLSAICYACNGAILKGVKYDWDCDK